MALFVVQTIRPQHSWMPPTTMWTALLQTGLVASLLPLTDNWECLLTRHPVIVPRICVPQCTLRSQCCIQKCIFQWTCVLAGVCLIRGEQKNVFACKVEGGGCAAGPDQAAPAEGLQLGLRGQRGGPQLRNHAAEHDEATRRHARELGAVHGVAPEHALRRPHRRHAALRWPR